MDIRRIRPTYANILIGLVQTKDDQRVARRLRAESHRRFCNECNRNSFREQTLRQLDR